MNIILDGSGLGAIYALIALGYTMVYGIAKLLNFAHGDIIMVGAYAILTMLNANGNPWIAIIVSVVVCTAAGIIIERFAYRPLRSASPLAVLITAIGVSYFLQSLAQLVFGAKSRPVTLPALGNINTDSLPDVFNKWMDTDLAKSLNCHCPAVKCLGPNVLVKNMYYEDQQFISGSVKEIPVTSKQR